MSERRDRRGRVPFDMDTAAEGISGRSGFFNWWLFTCQVTDHTLVLLGHSGRIQRFYRAGNYPTAGV